MPTAIATWPSITARAAITPITSQFVFNPNFLVYFGDRTASSYSQVPKREDRLMTGDASYSLLPVRRQRLSVGAPAYSPLPRRDPR